VSRVEGQESGTPAFSEETTLDASPAGVLQTPRGSLFGVEVDLLDMEQSLTLCERLIASHGPVQHVVLNAGKVVMMEDVVGLRELIRGCSVVNADGQSVVWVGRFLGVPIPERVAGIDLMEALLGKSAENGWPVYFLGAKQEVLKAFVSAVRERWPDIVIAGFRDGYFDDDAEVAAQVAASGARLVFVGISSPRKEFFLAEQQDVLGPIFSMGVGGSFDVWAGVTRRAPLWMQRSGLEWFYRFLQEPGRMWKRYLVGNSRFLWLVLRERWGRRRSR
jgi:N-acetylglucosaminyldiphosphoundecaprenol N-acetyl-beta-D-mannosaminyltransferase